MSLVFSLLIEKRSGVTCFDTGGEALELADVANAVANRVGGGAVVRAPFTSDRSDHYVGDGANYARLLARFGIEPVSLGDQVAETAEFMRDVT
jgi:nucleoside-diphosphate-sugar epimerase